MQPLEQVRYADRSSPSAFPDVHASMRASTWKISYSEMEDQMQYVPERGTLLGLLIWTHVGQSPASAVAAVK